MVGSPAIYTRDDIDLIVMFAGCSLDEKPGSNWVQGAGGLPRYICEVARAIKRSGKTTSQAISIAVSRIKKWAAGVGVDKKTQVKAAAALAEWEKLKVKSRVKTAAKEAGKAAGKAAMSRADENILCLANATDYDVSIVPAAFEQRTREARSTWRAANPNASYDDGPANLYVKEQWTTFLIVSSGYGRDRELYKVPYTVSEDNDVSFGDPVEVKTEYVVVDDGDEPGADITDEALRSMMNLAGPPVCHHLDVVLRASAALSPLQQIMAIGRGGGS